MQSTRFTSGSKLLLPALAVQMPGRTTSGTQMSSPRQKVSFLGKLPSGQQLKIALFAWRQVPFYIHAIACYNCYKNCWGDRITSTSYLTIYLILILGNTSLLSPCRLSLPRSTHHFRTSTQYILLFAPQFRMSYKYCAL